jgi:hypothetical protein
VPLVDEAGALADHGRVPKHPSSSSIRASRRGLLASALLAGAGIAWASPARADPLYTSGAPGTPGAPVASGGAPAFARVHIVTTARRLDLERRAGSLPGEPPPVLRAPYASSDGWIEWQRVCTAPCDTEVQLGGEYRVAGEGVTTSGSFALHGPATELRVDPGSSGVRRAGSALTVIGGIAALAGGIFLGVSAIHPAGQPASTLGIGGYASIGALAGGGALVIAGIGMIIGGGTSVQDEAHHDLARSAPPPPTLHATFLF